MFKKLNADFSNLKLENLLGEFQVSWNNNKFFQYLIKDKVYLKECLKDKIKFNIFPDMVNITKIVYPGARPHTDRWPTALNIYLTTGGAPDVTTYWQNPKDGSLEKSITEGKPIGYQEDSLKEAATFVANVYDCYLLDTHQIHSVIVSGSEDPRYMLRFAWEKYGFDEILKSIEII